MRDRRLAVLAAVIASAGCDRVFGLGDPQEDARVEDVGADVTPSLVTYVRSTCQLFPTGAGPYTLVLPTATPGNLLIASLSHAGPAGSSMAVSDNANTPFVEDLRQAYSRTGQLYHLASIAAGTTAITAMPDASARAPLTFCATEFAGAATDPIDARNVVRQGASGGSAGPENVDGLSLTAVGGDLVHIAVFDGQGLPIAPGVGFDARSTSAVLGALLEDTTTSSIDATRILGTLDSGASGTFDPWVAMAVAIKPR